ncbi:MAG TPA: DUF4232 domain-containing protein [Actinocrinis sp.]|nr:DUF4232 domain-containing protein [Actinocrinis sp.]
MRTGYKNLGTGLGACAAALALTACSGSSGSAGGGATSVPPIVALGGSPGSLASPSQSGTALPGSADSGLDHCHADGLKASTTYDTAQSQGNTLSVYVILTNTTHSLTCTVYGFAGLDFLDPGGKSLGMTVHRTNDGSITPINPVTLAPGQSAAERFTFLSAENDQGNSCENAGTISVIPPNETVALHTPLTNMKTGSVPYFGVCTSTITAYPFTPASAIPK